MPVTVDELVVVPFLSRTMDAKIKIVAEGKPRPQLKMAAVITVNVNQSDNSELQTHEFYSGMYDEIQWLTGCDKNDTFFCWPCLLFAQPSTVWNTTGIGDLGTFLESKSEHEESCEHMQATLKLQEMIELTTRVTTIDVGEHNEIVKRNRAILKRMIDVACNLIAKEQPYYERINNCELSPENFLKNLKFLRAYDVLNCNYIEDAVDLIQISPTIVNDLVNTITKEIVMSIRKEVQQSTYVSIILSDHSTIPEKSQISTVLRYLKAGKVCEKFIGFINPGNQKVLDVIYKNISNVLSEFVLSERFLALAIDGGILQTHETIELVSMLKDMYPFTFFVPWYGHGLDYVLQQSLANMSECSAFFRVMNELKSYFQKKSKRFKSLENWMAKSVPSLKDTKWFVRSQFIKVVNTYRKHFLQYFDSILQSTVMWEPEDIAKAMGFTYILEDFHTIFLLEAISRLFEHTATLNKILKSATPEKIFTIGEVSILRANLTAARDFGFDALWSDIHVKKCNEKPGPASKKVKIDEDDPKIPEYRQLYVSIVTRMLQELDVRFKNLDRLNFCQMLCCDGYGNFSFGNDFLQSLMAAHGAFFDEEQLRSESIVLRTNGKVFSNKSVYEILDFLLNSNLKGTFKYIYKLAELILTLPIKPPTVGGDKSKLKEIKSWSYVPGETLLPLPGDSSVPCVELDYLQELKKSPSFHDEIAVIFYELNKTFELLPR